MSRRPSTSTTTTTPTAMTPSQTSSIKNAFARSRIFQEAKIQRAKQRFEAKLKRKAERQMLGQDIPAPKTIESKRVKTEVFVEPGDEEIAGDDAMDEFSSFWVGNKTPKIMITTRPRPSKDLFKFIGDLMSMIPYCYYHPRKTRELKEMSNWAIQNEFTHLIVLSENKKICNRLTLGLLPNGPCAQFKVSSIVPRTEIDGHGNPTQHLPEIILNNFATRLGHRIGRFLGTLFPHSPEFEGRTAVTFHNQRDFIFVRHHRYAFKQTFSGADLQELGPRFTLKLKWLASGNPFDNRNHIEYEFLREKEPKTKQLGAEGKEFML
jgi:ribosome production factor 1